MAFFSEAFPQIPILSWDEGTVPIPDCNGINIPDVMTAHWSKFTAPFIDIHKKRMLLYVNFKMFFKNFRIAKYFILF